MCACFAQVFCSFFGISSECPPKSQLSLAVLISLPRKKTIFCYAVSTSEAGNCLIALIAQLKPHREKQPGLGIKSCQVSLIFRRVKVVQDAQRISVYMTLK